MKKRLLAILSLIFLLSACSFWQNNENQKPSKQNNSPAQEKITTTQEETPTQGLIDVKYRDDQIDLSSFETLDTSNSSFIGGAWYDAENEYMIIDISGTNYQYCNLPAIVWENFKNASSFGKEYNQKIKSNYACE